MPACARGLGDLRCKFVPSGCISVLNAVSQSVMLVVDCVTETEVTKISLESQLPIQVRVLRR